MFHLVMCVPFGIGIGIGYLIGLVCAWEFFPNRKGLITGIVFGALGSGSLYFNFISLAIVNPDGLEADVILENGDSLFGEEVAK